MSHNGDTAMQPERRQGQGTQSAGNSREDEEGKEWTAEDYKGRAEEEVQASVTRRAPKGPTQEEREKHEATHLPFREWCPHCIRGRGRNKPHKKKADGEEEEHRVSRISMDPFFMSQEEEKASR